LGRKLNYDRDARTGQGLYLQTLKSRGYKTGNVWSNLTNAAVHSLK